MAYCTKDGKPWDAKMLRDEAKKHPPEWLEERRQKFLCGGCEEKARFINGTKRNPHFGIVRGYEHAWDCDFLGDTEAGSGGTGAPMPDRDAAKGNKEVRYADPGPLNPPPAAAGGNGGAAAPTGPASPAAGQGPLHESKLLQTLLKNLRNRPDYPPADLFLDVSARGTAVRATDYFHNIAEITGKTATDGHTRAYWGQISSAHDDGDGKNLWINCDGKGDVFTIRIDYDIKEALYKALEIERTWDLYGAHVIVEGVMKQGARKLSVNVTDLQKIAFLPRR